MPRDLLRLSRGFGNPHIFKLLYNFCLLAPSNFESVSLGSSFWETLKPLLLFKVFPSLSKEQSTSKIVIMEFEITQPGCVKVPSGTRSLVLIEADGSARSLELGHCNQSGAFTNPLLDNADLMRITHYSSRTLQRFRSCGLLAYEKCGNRIFYRLEDVMRFFNERFVRMQRPRIEIPDQRCGEDPVLKDSLMDLAEMKPLNRFTSEYGYFRRLFGADEAKGK